MQKEDWQKIAKWIGLVYAPIALLIVFIFLVVEWETAKVDDARRSGNTLSTTTLIR